MQVTQREAICDGNRTNCQVAYWWPCNSAWRLKGEWLGGNLSGASKPRIPRKM